MDASEAATRIDGMQVLDVREYYEWAAGHVASAVNIPLRHLLRRFEELDLERPVLVTCQIGQRSALATALLRERGFDAHNLEGGLEAWVAGGLSLVDVMNESGEVIDGWAQTLE